MAEWDRYSSDHEILAKVIEIAAGVVGISEGGITSESSFEELGADSLDNANLMMELEDEFNLLIPDEEMEKLLTVGKAVDFIKNKLASPVVVESWEY
ncbi:MAG: acyl carrier protein [Candidatus Parcubacteria bacterium]|nr:acyl carrier protein [Candidatus Parcubacteria bacterium]